jgi:DNA polymerase (family 10)
VALRAALAGVPWLLRRLIELHVLAAHHAVLLVRQLGAVTLPDLELVLDDGRLAQALPEFERQRVTAAIEVLDRDAQRVPLGRALDLVDGLLAHLRSAAPAARVSPAGDVRRFEPLVRDLALVVAAPEPADVIDAICVSPAVSDVLHRGSRRVVVQHQQVEVDLRVAASDEYGTVLFTATGSRGHVAAVAARRGRPALWPREEDLYRQAGLAWVPPELRHASGEIDAAARGALPRLLERRDIRGDLHMHSTYSDGRDTISEMATACAALGYDYIAISDHSERAAASRTLSIDDIARQREEIEALGERFPAMAILHGVEVDILLDGSLDFPDAVLERFEIVLASLHESGRQDPRTLTRRCIQAIRHPLVNVITHPTNRLVGRTPGYALDWDAVHAAAAETGTAMEIDGAPAHLDMDGEHAHAAVAAGVTVVLDSDCHRARSLGRQMEMAVGTARRGWVEPRHVLNARPLAAVRAFIAAKRTRQP